MRKTTSLINGKHTVDLGGIEGFKKVLKSKMIAKVGVLGGSPAREEGAVTNADLGMIHEYGTSDGRIPARSWLRMPLQFKMPEVYKSMGGALIDAAFRGEKRLALQFSLLGKRAEAVIQRAFGSRGFGNWAPNKPSTIRQKGSDSPLIDTAEFRKSITSEVATKGGAV